MKKVPDRILFPVFQKLLEFTQYQVNPAKSQNVLYLGSNRHHSHIGEMIHLESVIFLLHDITNIRKPPVDTIFMSVFM